VTTIYHASNNGLSVANYFENTVFLSDLQKYLASGEKIQPHIIFTPIGLVYITSFYNGLDAHCTILGGGGGGE
jgi:hypothetical protein